MKNRVSKHADRLMMYPQIVEMNVDGSINNMHPLCMVNSSGKNDTYHFHDAMRQPDREEFIKAMVKELKDHHENKHWKLVKRSKRIIEVMGSSISEANVKSTPSVYKEVLHKDENRPIRKLNWNYRSVVGMLNYLAASTRPDKLFAVHQCAKFAADQKLSHERAIKRIVRYLKGTPNGGIMLRPNPKDGIKCYVNADFAGGYCDETKDDPVSVYSRTEYVIFYFGCPVQWVSKLQSEISLSTVEAEYIALSAAMRDVIPFVDQVNKLSNIFGETAPEIELHCTLFEDNNGALELATKPRYRPQTKHIAIKYHHFREKVQKGLF